MFLIVTWLFACVLMRIYSSQVCIAFQLSRFLVNIHLKLLVWLIKFLKYFFSDWNWLKSYKLSVLCIFKNQQTKQAFYRAKYGRFGITDPFTALQRDSEQVLDDQFDHDQVRCTPLELIVFVVPVRKSPFLRSNYTLKLFWHLTLALLL